MAPNKRPLVKSISFLFYLYVSINPNLLDANASIPHLLHEAKKQLKVKEWEGAKNTLQNILQNDPQNKEAYANLGVAFSRTNQHKKALLAYEKALQFGFDNSMFRYNRGYSFAKLNLFEEAEKEYKKALALNSRLLLAEYHLGLIYNQQTRQRKALQQVIKIYPKNYKLALKLHKALPGIYKVITVKNAGKLKGQVKLLGTQPTPRAFHLIHSPNIKYCNRMSDGKGHRIVYDFVRSDNFGLKDTVISIQGIQYGKPFLPNLYSMKINLCHSKDYVVGIRNGDDFVIENMDPIKHEIATYEVHKANHTKTSHRLINSSKIKQKSNKSVLPNSSQIRTAFIHPDSGEFIIKCNLHPFLQTTGWMVDNPYFTRTDKEGQFIIAGIPPGKYEVIAWHPYLDPIKGIVIIKPNRTATLNFTFQSQKEKRKLYSNDIKGYRFNSWYDSFENFYGGKRVDDPIEILQKL